MTTIAWERAAVRPGMSIVDTELAAGEICLLAGPTGSGKSTLLRTVNGTASDSLTGRVRTMGRDIATQSARGLADVVSIVPARAADAFVATTVEDEIGYGLARLRLSPVARTRRIEELLAAVGIAELRTRPLSALSAGQQHRVAIAGALATEPDVLMLDEPTASLDPAGAAAIGRRLQTLARVHGTTVLLAEHRAERVLDYLDSVLYLPGDGPARHDRPATVLPGTPVAPPIIELSTLLNWNPPAITIEQALAAALTHSLPEPDPSLAPELTPVATVSRDQVVGLAQGLSVRHGPLIAVQDLDLALHAGEIVALVGSNGAGKSTLLQAFAGLLRPEAGSVRTVGQDPVRLRGTDRIRRVGLVPADPAELLLADRVETECAGSDAQAGLPPGRTAALLEGLLPGVAPRRPTQALSTGERQALALAIVLARGPRLILLDEPTQGLDYPAKRRLTGMLRQLAREGHTVLVATHDAELTAALASRVVTMTDGTVTADAPIADALRQHTVTTQVGQIMAPAPLYTVDDVRRELAT